MKGHYMNDEKDPTWTDIDVDPRTHRFRGVATHGNTPFDMPFITHVMDNLWQGGCEDGMVLPEEIKHVVSLYKWERYEVNHVLSSYEEITAYDSADEGSLGGMSEEQVLDLAAMVNRRRADAPTLVHCQAGLNRSGLIAATALLLNGDVLTGADAVALLRQQRSPAVLCNPLFESWLVGRFP